MPATFLVSTETTIFASPYFLIRSFRKFGFFINTEFKPILSAPELNALSISEMFLKPPINVIGINTDFIFLH